MTRNKQVREFFNSLFSLLQYGFIASLVMGAAIAFDIWIHGSRLTFGHHITPGQGFQMGFKIAAAVMIIEICILLAIDLYQKKRKKSSAETKQ